MSDDKFIIKLFAVVKGRKSAFDTSRKLHAILPDEATVNMDIQVCEASAMEKPAAE